MNIEKEYINNKLSKYNNNLDNINSPIDRVYTLYDYLLTNKNNDFNIYRSTLQSIELNISNIILEIRINTFDESKNFERISVNNKKKLDKSFLYYYNDDTKKILTISRTNNLKEELAKLLIEINIIIDNYETYPILNINIIILCLNYQLLITSYYYILNSNKELDGYEDLEVSQKKIIKHLNFLINIPNIVLLPSHKTYRYSILNKFGDIPIFILSLSKKPKKAHGVILYPLSYFFHDIQHSYEIYQSKYKMYDKLLESNMNKKNLLKIFNLNKINYKNNDYEYKLRLKIYRRLHYTLFFYLHEYCYTLDDKSKIIDNLLYPSFYKFYTNRFKFIEDKMLKSFNKDNDSIIYTTSRNILKKIYSLNNNNKINFENIRLKVTDCISLICYLFNRENNSDLDNISLSIIDVIESSKKYLLDKYNINIIKQNRIIFIDDYYVDSIHEELIQKLIKINFIEIYSEDIIEYGYIRSNIINIIGKIFIYPKNNKIASKIIEIIYSKEIYLLMLIEDIKNNILFNNLLTNKYIPIYIQLILLIEIFKIDKDLYSIYSEYFYEREDLVCFRDVINHTLLQL